MRIYADSARFIQISGNLIGVCRDPKDGIVLECAIVAGATHIVSGDKDLISLNTYSGISILTPREFLELFGRAPTVP